MSLAEFFASLGVATAKTLLSVLTFGLVCFIAGFITCLIVKWVIKLLGKLIFRLWRLVRGLK